MTDFINELVSSVGPLLAEKSISLEYDPCAPLMIKADPTRFKQILYNLLSNAVKFTPAQGRVSLECALVGPWAEFCVCDTGIGIPKEEQAAIFGKFHQIGSSTKSGLEGTGLGLTITKHLVELHGGRIWLDSEPGAGSRFYFTLPL
jgi:signal transduction histidine kinase